LAQVGSARVRGSLGRFLLATMSFLLVAIATWFLPQAEAYEWAGIFRVSYDHYQWIAQKDHDAYADASMKIVALPASELTMAELKALEPSGNASLFGECTDVQNGGTFTPAADTCYRLVFDTAVWQTVFDVDTTGVDKVAFFTEHVPTEFESSDHYLKDDHGHDIEPFFELPEIFEQVYWLESIGAALAVNLITLVGVIISTPCMGGTEARAAFFEALLSSFAAGALLACAFFLLLFEATHLVGTGWANEVDVLWRWGTAILAGFFLPVLIESAGMVFYSSSGETAPEGKMSVEMGEGLQPVEVVDEAAKAASRARVIGAVLIGDFFHNLCDGFFIAAAFKGCGPTFAWGVVLGTCLHELPQELADYAILTGSDVGFSPLQALTWNFGTGLSVLLGALVVNLMEVSDSTIGLLLAFGGGTYVYLASVVCMPKLSALNGSLSQNLMGLLAFVLGTVLIGLILLDHKHCAAHGHAH